MQGLMREKEKRGSSFSGRGSQSCNGRVGSLAGDRCPAINEGDCYEGENGMGDAPLASTRTNTSPSPSTITSSRSRPLESKSLNMRLRVAGQSDGVTTKGGEGDGGGRVQPLQQRNARRVSACEGLHGLQGAGRVASERQCPPLSRAASATRWELGSVRAMEGRSQAASGGAGRVLKAARSLV